MPLTINYTNLITFDVNYLVSNHFARIIQILIDVSKSTLPTCSLYHSFELISIFLMGFSEPASLSVTIINLTRGGKKNIYPCRNA